MRAQWTNLPHRVEEMKRFPVGPRACDGGRATSRPSPRPARLDCAGLPMRPTPLLLAAVLCLPGPGWTQEPPRKLKVTRKDGVPRLDLGAPAFQPLPTVERAAAADAGPAAPAVAGDEWQVLSVVHQRRGPASVPGEPPLAEVALSGAPLASEAFSTVVRVRNPARRGGRIEIAIVDGRQRTLLEASGELAFRGKEEAEWGVDWARTPFRAPTAAEVQVRVGGLLVSSTPIKFAEKGK